jgi:hypothetical protein
MRKELLTIGILSVFLTSMLIPVSHAFYVYNPPIPSGYCFSPVIAGNDAGYAYNLSGITFVTTLVNLTGTFKYNYSEGGFQAANYYIALGQYNQYGTYYIQPVIVFATNGNIWVLEWSVQAWGDNSGSPYKEYNTSGLITYGLGSSANLNYVFNLTIKASLNSQGQITSGTTPTNFPIIPSSNYIFVNASASNSSIIFEGGLPLYNGVEFVMEEPKAMAYVVPTFGFGSNNMGTQGVQYIW